MATINPSNQQISQYSIQTGGASNLLNNVAPSATSGVPVISQGASAQPVFGTAVVAGGGTGQTTLTNHGVLVGAGTSAITQLAAGSVGQVLQSGGASADPVYSTATFPATATGTGTLLRADGTNWTATTSTYPNTNAVSTLLYASSANVMSALATANSGVLTTDASGVPSIDTTNFVRQTTGMQMKGNNTNTAPPAGFIGEQIRGYATGIVFANTTPKTVTSISVTAGVWDICGIVYTVTTGNSTAIAGGIGTTTDSFTGTVIGDSYVQNNFATVGSGTFSIGISGFRVTLSGTTTYYLVGLSAFSTGSSTGSGRISATRVG